MVPNQNYYVDQGNFVKFGLVSMKNPGSIDPTSAFSLTLYDQNYEILTVSPNTDLIYTATPGLLQYIKIEPYNYKTREAVIYNFSFEAKNDLY